MPARPNTAHGICPALPLTRRAFAAAALAGATGLLAGCVDQHPHRSASGDARLVATSPAVADMCDKLELPLVGVPKTSSTLPARYRGVKKVGMAMSPDLEILKSLDPDCVISPNALKSDLQPKYAASALACIFVDLESVPALYSSLSYLGTRFDRRAQAAALVADYEAYIEQYRASVKGEKAPRVLVLMGVPGSYVVATPKSYAGSLVELAGGRNVYRSTSRDFLNANTEDMLTRDPDIILRTAHALPAQVMQSFAKEFRENDIWKHFRAVKEDRVFDLDSTKFGMSATFAYPDALADLQPMLYGNATGSDGTSAANAPVTADTGATTAATATTEGGSK